MNLQLRKTEQQTIQAKTRLVFSKQNTITFLTPISLPDNTDKMRITTSIWERGNANLVKSHQINHEYLSGISEYATELAYQYDIIRQINGGLYVKTPNAFFSVTSKGEFTNGFLNGDGVLFDNLSKSKLVYITDSLSKALALHKLGCVVLWTINKYNISKCVNEFTTQANIGLKKQVKLKLAFVVNKESVYTAQRLIQDKIISAKSVVYTTNDLHEIINDVALAGDTELVDFKKALDATKKGNFSLINGLAEWLPENQLNYNVFTSMRKLNRLPFNQLHARLQSALNEVNAKEEAAVANYIKYNLEIEEPDIETREDFYVYHRLNQRYISQDIDLELYRCVRSYDKNARHKQPAAIHYIQSPLGTGKTELIANALKSMYNSFKKYEQEDASDLDVNTPDVVIINPRKVLTSALAKRLSRETGQVIHDYQQLPNSTYAEVSNIAIVINSIHYLKDKTGHILIIDELEQCMKQITSSIISNKRVILEALYNLIKNASVVIGVDADLSNVTLEKLIEMHKKIWGVTEEEKYYIDPDERVIPDVWFNTYKPAQDKEISLFKNSESLFNELSNDIQADKKIFLACNSLALANQIELFVQKVKPDLRRLIITSENSTHPDIIEFVANIEDRVQEYDLIIVSPALTSGVSINLTEKIPEPYFDHIYGFFYNNKNCGEPLDSVQQIARVRYVKSLKIWYEDKFPNLETNFAISTDTINRADLIRDFLPTDKPATFKYAGEDGTDVVVELKPHRLLSMYANMYGRYSVMTNKYLNSGRVAFIQLCRRVGYKVRVIQEEYVTLETATRIEVVKSDYKTKKIDDIVNAPDLTKQQIERFERQQEFTPTEKNMIEKYNIGVFYNTDNVTAELVELDDGGKTRNILMERLEMLQTVNPLLSTADGLLDVLDSDLVRLNSYTEQGSDVHFAPKIYMVILYNQIIEAFKNNPQGLNKNSPELGKITRYMLENSLVLSKHGVNTNSLSKDPIRVISSVLRRVGGKLYNKKLRIDGQLTRNYTLGFDEKYTDLEEYLNSAESTNSDYADEEY